MWWICCCVLAGSFLEVVADQTVGNTANNGTASGFHWLPIGIIVAWLTSALVVLGVVLLTIYRSCTPSLRVTPKDLKASLASYKPAHLQNATEDSEKYQNPYEAIGPNPKDVILDRQVYEYMKPKSILKKGKDVELKDHFPSMESNRVENTVGFVNEVIDDTEQNAV